MVANKVRQALAPALLFGSIYAISWLLSEPLHAGAEFFAASLYLGAILVMISAIDWVSFRIPDHLNLALALGAILKALFTSDMSLPAYALAALAWGLAVAACDLLYKACRSRHGIGLGDVKLFAAGALWLGAPATISMLLWACAAGLLHFAALAAVDERLDLQQRIPFGPHLSFGLWLVWLFGPDFP